MHEKRYMKAFSNRLKTLRKSSGLTLKQLASKLDVSEAYVSMLESGKRQPARALVLQLADRLGAGSDSPLRDELLILAGFSPENLARFEAPRDPLGTYQQALLDAPEDFSLFQGYVQTLLKTGREAEALAQIDLGFKRFQNAYQLQCLVADLELARGHLDAARLAQQAALEQYRLEGIDAPRLEGLLIANLGGICFQLGMQQLGAGQLPAAQASFAEAEAHFAEALERDSDNLFSRDEYARVCFNLADLASGEAARTWWERSRQAFEAVFAGDPKPNLAESALRESAAFWAYAIARCGEPEQARRQLWLQSSLAPADWLARYLLASVNLLIFARSGEARDLAAAAQSFARSLAIHPSAALNNGRDDPHLAVLRERHPELFAPRIAKDPPAKEP